MQASGPTLDRPARSVTRRTAPLLGAIAGAIAGLTVAAPAHAPGR